MNIQKKPHEKEILRLERAEMSFRRKYAEKDSSLISRLLTDKVPAGMQNTLYEAFEKAFAIVFEKGTDIIALSYKRSSIEKRFKDTTTDTEFKANRKALKSFSKKAEGSKALNTAISGAAGISMGLLGIGVPDIILFTALMLKTIYETALHYGYEYDSNAERCFILRLIYTALCRGEDFIRADEEINSFIEKGEFNEPLSIVGLIRDAANALSKDLLYMKFLQGIPVVGVVGGAYDALFMERIGSYAELKYRKRFYQQIKKDS